MPLNGANLFRVLIMLALATHVFVMYSVARTVLGGFGFSVGVTITAMIFAFIMLTPLIWAVILPEWPEIYTRHVRARRWFRAGRCPACGYQLAGEVAVCSECGAAYQRPQPYAISARTIRIFVMINLLAWIIGSVAGEAWTIDDERAFVREVNERIEEGYDRQYVRARRWPVESTSMMYKPGEAISNTRSND